MTTSAEGVIEVRILEIAQLFNSLDPSPFHERDLDADAEEHIVSWARELPAHLPLRIVVHLPQDQAEKAGERGLGTALNNYFGYRAGKYQRDLAELFRTGRRYLSIGIAVLVACLIASRYVEAALGPRPIARALEESLIIVGWVANWKPLEIFLYDWWPLARRRNLYRRLAAATVTVRPSRPDQ